LKKSWICFIIKSRTGKKAKNDIIIITFFAIKSKKAKVNNPLHRRERAYALERRRVNSPPA